MFFNLEYHNISPLLSEGMTLLRWQKNLYVYMSLFLKMIHQFMVIWGQFLWSFFHSFLLLWSYSYRKFWIFFFIFPSRQNELNRDTNCLPFSYISHCKLIIRFSGLYIIYCMHDDESVPLTLFNSDSLSLWFCMYTLSLNYSN